MVIKNILQVGKNWPIHQTSWHILTYGCWTGLQGAFSCKIHFSPSNTDFNLEADWKRIKGNLSILPLRHSSPLQLMVNEMYSFGEIQEKCKATCTTTPMERLQAEGYRPTWRAERSTAHVSVCASPRLKHPLLANRSSSSATGWALTSTLI